MTHIACTVSTDGATYDHVVVAPGQGVAQAGMLDGWLDAGLDDGGSVAMLAEWSAAAGVDLIAASRDAAALGDTAVAQPVIVAASLLSMELLREQHVLDDQRTLYAGHSVGELTAAACAGCLTPASAVTLARVRGIAMAAACTATPTGMAAVMPARRDPASDDAIRTAIDGAGLTLANANGSHQFVAAGPRDRLEAFAAARPTGLRIAHLAVAGAFHTDAMAAAVAPFADAVERTSFRRPAAALLANADGAFVVDAGDLRRRLITQISAPVRWDLCSATIAARSGPQTVQLELAPGGPLTKLLQRSRPEAEAVALHGPADVRSLRPGTDLVSRRAS